MHKKNEFGLTQKQENFCLEYIKCGIGYQAFKKAFPNSQKWKDNSVYCQVSKLMKNPKIKQRLEILQNEQKKGVQEQIILNKTKILQEIVKTYNETVQNGQSERASTVKLLELMSKISKLIGDTTINNNINIQNNTTVQEISGYLDI